MVPTDSTTRCTSRVSTLTTATWMGPVSFCACTTGGWPQAAESRRHTAPTPRTPGERKMLRKEHYCITRATGPGTLLGSCCPIRCKEIVMKIKRVSFGLLLGAMVWVDDLDS